MRKFQVLFLFVLTLFSLSNASKILAVFPTPSISHQVVFRAITHELARRGHEVTVITTDPVFPKEENLRTLKEIDVHDISYNIWSKTFAATATGNNDEFLNQISVATYLQMALFEAQLQTSEVSQILNKSSDYFDLIIIEAINRPSYVFTHFFKAPAVLVSSLGALSEQFELNGIPVHHILYPSSLRQKLSDLTMWDKLREIYVDIKISQMYSDHLPIEDEMLRKHLGPVPSLAELRNNFDMFFLNVYPIWDTNRPVPPNIIYMGGLHQNNPKELPQDLKKYLDESKNGVIYISFGTNVSPSLIPAEKIKMMMNVISKLPYNVLWKYDKDELPGQPKNIKLGKWFPQSDLLRHPNVKLFVTQGGLQSTDEAITAGVPLLGMPMLGDQWFNVEKYVTLNIGRRLDMEQLTEEKFKNLIEKLITDKSFRENIIDLRNKMQDQPMSPLDRTIWWMEYVIRHKGAKHLRSPAAGISWSEYLELPLVYTLLSIVLTVLLIIVLLIRFIYRQLFSKKSKVKKN